ncbi:MAG: PAS domain S-box protein, partial [Promethearchaeota archaeon]
KDLEPSYQILRIITQKEAIKWLELHTKTFSYNGKSAILIIFSNITDELVAQHDIIEEQLNYKLITENLNEMVVVLDDRFRIEHVNYAAKEILGNPGSLYPFKFENLQSSSLNSVYDFFKGVLKEDIYRKEMELLKKKGTNIWVEIIGKTFVGLDGNTKILAILRDISEQKEAEQKIQESERKYRELYDKSPFLILILNKDCIIVDMNMKFSESSTYDKNNLIGLNFTEFSDLIFNKYIHVKEKTFHDVLDGSPIELVDLPYILKSGKRSWINLKATPIKFQNEKYIQVIIQDITDKKEMEEMVKDSQEKLSTFMESAPDVFTIWDSELNLIEVNNTGVHFFGDHLKENLIGKNLVNLMPFNKEEDNLKEYLKVLKTGKNYFEDDVLIDPMGKFYVNQRVFKVGKELGMIITDITSQKLAEQIIRDSEKKFRTLFENSPYSIIITDEKGHVLDVNSYTEKIFMVYKSEILGERIDEILELPDHIKKFIQNVINESNQDTSPIEFKLFNREGDPLWIRAMYSIIELEEQKFFQIIIEDISQRKETENELINSEVKYRNLVNSSPDIIILTDVSGEILDCNERFTELLGLKKNELIGRKIQEIAPYNIKELQNLFSTGISVNDFEKKFESFYKNKDGKTYWFNNNVLLMKIHDELRIQVASQDITRLKEANIMIEEANKQLQELDDLRKSFTEQAAHELRTPLIPICGYSQIFYENFSKIIKNLEKMTIYMDLLNVKDINLKDMRESIHRVSKLHNHLNEDLRSMEDDFEYFRAGSEKLRHLAERLLNFSRIESDSLELDFESVNVHKILKDSISLIIPEAKKRNIEILYSNLEDIYIDADEISIFQVFQNLISNAIKNTFPDGNVIIDIEEKNSEIVVYVKDSGIGLIKEEIDVIFTKFGRIKREGAIISKGWGIGLYTSSKIIKQHGGRLWVESKGRNKGSIFHVQLPKVQH